MADAFYVPNSMIVNGNITYGGTLSPAPTRASLAQDTLMPFFIPWDRYRTWNDLAVVLPSTSANDDLGIYGNTWATGSPALETYDVKSAGALPFYARAQIALPPEYDDSQTVVIRANAGMVTTVADTSCTLDLVCFESDKAAGIGSDLCTTAAIDINGDTTLSNCDFTITATGLVSGDVLDIRWHVAVNDAAGGAVVKARIGYTALMCDIKG